MKFSVMCLAIICMVMLSHHVEVTAGTNKLVDGVVDPCKKPGGPHPGCNPNPNANRGHDAANDYDRGCSANHRCRKD
ncbi:hypothetical protein L484_014801 [Morus notabilis]|uniref:Uncharacterized protein n=1 Tax=Morus notabilis TaxID=981085 RepID=W9SA97_9ROSA|nr:hypothetical protein L484_014801 [Morus notabilis]